MLHDCDVIMNNSFTAGPNSENEGARVGPVYEEVGPAIPTQDKDIELQSNQAYGEVTINR